MPYLEDKKLRAALVNGNLSPITAGHLNYLITATVHKYLKVNGLNYGNINLVIGALECAKLEAYRMIAAPYEAKKRFANGPVSTLDAINLEEIR